MSAAAGERGARVIGIELRELEAFLVLAEELHFGRTGERLYLTQSRVSQLVRSLEQRIGGPLVERASRPVRLTPLGERLLADVRPAYDALRAGIDDARAAARTAAGVLRLGFQGSIDGPLATAVRRFEAGEGRPTVELTELPLSDPFGALRRSEVDAAVVLLPVAEDDLEVGAALPPQPVLLAVDARHPAAAREAVSADELAHWPLIDVDGPAPAYWREAQVPRRTPSGRRTLRPHTATTVHEGLSLTAAGRGAMLLCRETAEQHAGRRSVAFVPVDGLPESSLALVWRRGHRPPGIEALEQALLGAAAVTPR